MYIVVIIRKNINCCLVGNNSVADPDPGLKKSTYLNFFV
jgi:hypothetical protein